MKKSPAHNGAHPSPRVRAKSTPSTKGDAVAAQQQYTNGSNGYAFGQVTPIWKDWRTAGIAFIFALWSVANFLGSTGWLNLPAKQIDVDSLNLQMKIVNEVLVATNAELKSLGVSIRNLEAALPVKAPPPKKRPAQKPKTQGSLFGY